MNKITLLALGKECEIANNLDGFQAKVNTLRQLHAHLGHLAKSQAEMPPTLRSGDATRDALLPSVLDRAFKGEL